MSPVRMMCTLLVMALAIAVCGCFGGGDSGGRTASKGRFGRKEPAPERDPRKGQAARRAPAGQGDFSELSPEASMRRTYEELKVHEARQVKVVQEMRQAVAQGEDAIRKEEMKLEGIRNQLASYDMAFRKFESAPAPAQRDGQRASVVASSMYTDRAPAQPPRPDRGGYGRGYDSNPGYDARTEAASYRSEQGARYGQPPANPHQANAGYHRDDRQGGYEQTLYDPRGMDPRQAPSGGGYSQTAPRAPVNNSYASGYGQNDGWQASGNLYSDASSRPQYRTTENTLRPEPRIQPTSTPVHMETSVPAAGASMQPRMPVQPQEPAPHAPNGSLDEVFSPDLYLSGGR